MRRSAAIAIFTLLMAVPLFAHHPFSQDYDWKKPDTIVGTVSSVEWKSPHVFFVVDGKDDHGTSGEWRVELGSPAELSKYGWTMTTLKPAQRVTVDGWLAKNGTRQLNAKSVMPEGGKSMFGASSFFLLSPAPVATSGVQ
jgi:hypothetical protein